MPPQRLPLVRLSSSLAPIACGAAIALACTLVAVGKVSFSPLAIHLRDLQTAGATTRLMPDFDRSRITDQRAEWDYFDMLRTRAYLTAQIMATAPAVEHIGRHAGIPAEQIASVAPITLPVSGSLTEPGSEQRAHELALAHRPYRLEVESQPGSPIVTVHTQAPTVAEAERLANASIDGLQDYLREVASDRGFGRDAPIRFVQLGQPHGAPLTPDTGRNLAVVAFLVTFALAYWGLRSLGGFRSRRRRVPESENGASAEPPARGLAASHFDSAGGGLQQPPLPDPGGTVSLRPGGLVAMPRTMRTSVDVWPRTTRVLPWMIAAFLALLWLVPFDSIRLAVPSPIDLKLDRVLLPILVAMWILALALGGRAAPRLRTTPIHVAVGAFVAVAFLSVILDAEELNRALELDISLKKLPLLVSYLSLFLVMTSTIRREEVAAFFKYSLVLAVICSLGMIWEDVRFHNLFFEWSQTLLPAPFEVQGESTSGWDSVGRRLVHGPAGHPLTAVAMLSLVMPLAVLGVIHADRPRQRLLYGLAACLLLLAMLATQRKSGLVGPFAGILALAYFRRRELLRLVPLGVVLLAVLALISPGTLAPVVSQFKPEHLVGANTVSDRAADYDAVRPDFWTHVAFGRGFGSYQPVGHRFLDSEVLVRLVETGAVGLASFLLLGISVVAVARRTIQSRDPKWAPWALAGAAAAVVFLVMSTLFDAMSFPQVPYIFLSFAALVAVVVKPHRQPPVR